MKFNRSAIYCLFSCLVIGGGNYAIAAEKSTQDMKSMSSVEIADKYSRLMAMNELLSLQLNNAKLESELETINDTSVTERYSSLQKQFDDVSEKFRELSRKYNELQASQQKDVEDTTSAIVPIPDHDINFVKSLGEGVKAVATLVLDGSRTVEVLAGDSIYNDIIVSKITPEYVEIVQLGNGGAKTVYLKGRSKHISESFQESSDDQQGRGNVTTIFDANGMASKPKDGTEFSQIYPVPMTK